ncbi:hypothetical protein [Rhizobium sp. MHM7A]|uniref:hypothetical protein n=1 Tax=Rhizobium sp. MHM7A TaxID=2583233 RepID=UPI001105C0C6|nr:hypothetical protein [Rhizobium sp. MHM7A]TLX11753.1 hypothetical protein FFR93_19940 [Rhizobium sp. MHM7A]
MVSLDGELLASNDAAPLVLLDGPNNLGLYTAIEQALSHVSVGAVVGLFAPQEELLHVFGEGLAHLQKRDFRKRDRKPFAHRDQIRAVFDLAVAKDAELLALKPHTSEEYAMYYQASDFARDRLRETLERHANA